MEQLNQKNNESNRICDRLKFWTNQLQGLPKYRKMSCWVKKKKQTSSPFLSGHLFLTFEYRGALPLSLINVSLLFSSAWCQEHKYLYCKNWLLQMLCLLHLLEMYKSKKLYICWYFGRFLGQQCSFVCKRALINRNQTRLCQDKFWSGKIADLLAQN